MNRLFCCTYHGLKKERKRMEGREWEGRKRIEEGNDVTIETGGGEGKGMEGGAGRG
jgi:hypothetical protein